MTVATMTAPLYRERVMQFGRSGTLFGMWCEPKDAPTRPPVVILGAGILHRIGPSRIAVHLARELASRGHPVLRFDLSGIGDSPRPAESSLEEAVRADIDDAVTLAAQRVQDTVWADQVVLVGFCAGADNALHVSSVDPRICAAVLFDPTVHKTAGFHRRELMRKLTSTESWRNVLSGRSLKLRLDEHRARATRPVAPPGYFGLLVSSPEETERRARAFRDRGGQLRFVISRTYHAVCNAPEQIEESMPDAFTPEQFHVVWTTHLDHVFSTRSQIRWFVEDTAHWLAGLTPR